MIRDGSTTLEFIDGSYYTGITRCASPLRAQHADGVLGLFSAR